MHRSPGSICGSAATRSGISTLKPRTGWLVGWALRFGGTECRLLRWGVVLRRVARPSPNLASQGTRLGLGGRQCLRCELMPDVASEVADLRQINLSDATPAVGAGRRWRRRPELAPPSARRPLGPLDEPYGLGPIDSHQLYKSGFGARVYMILVVSHSANFAPRSFKAGD
jgi:hypothetical protein